MNTHNSRNHQPESLLSRLSIKSNLLLGFGAVVCVMLLSVIGAIIFSARVNNVVDDITNDQLPTTVYTFQVARTADALATYGLSLATLADKEARDSSFEQINKAIEALHLALDNLETIVINKDIIPINLFAELEDNIRHLQVIVNNRIELREQQLHARKDLLSNLLVLQRQLIYRVRILEGDGDVIQRLMARTEPPVEKVAAMSKDLTKLLPAARFYATVESINGSLLAGSLSPSLTSLSTSRQELTTSLVNLRETFYTLPEDVRNDLDQALIELEELALQDNGLIQLRERELLLLEQIMNLNNLNKSILQRVNSETSKMVFNSQNEMVETGNTLMLFGKKAMFILIFFAVLSLICVGTLMHFYVNGKILSRLSWLSASMQDVAAGRLNVNLPPSGSNELGRLGAALQQFRDITSQAHSREIALNQTMEELKVKSAELERLSITDSLTGLANRMELDSVLQLEVRRAIRYEHPISIILMDIDHFKKVNDKFGHQEGDKVLQNVAQAIQQDIREIDTSGRWGGEEFLIICPETNLHQAANIATKLQKQLRALDHHPVHIVTSSFGVAELGPSEDETVLIKRADKALYRAKENGRDMVETA